MTDGTLFDIASRNVKLTLYNPAIMARYCVGFPIILLVTVAYAWNRLAV